MNLIKAFEGLSASDKPSTGDASAETAQSAPAETDAPCTVTPDVTVGSNADFNAMQSILERHEAISNRVRQNNARK